MPGRSGLPRGRNSFEITKIGFLVYLSRLAGLVVPLSEGHTYSQVDLARGEGKVAKLGHGHSFP